MIGKILNLGKKQEFYLTIEDAEDSVPVVAEAKVEEAKPEPAPQAIVVEETETKPAPQATKKSQTTTKKESIKKTVAPSASSWEEPFWVKAMYNNTGSGGSASTSGTTTEETFATDYLVVQSASRRRPGPSLNKFKDMVAKKRF